MKTKVLIVGGGAAGMMAAVSAATALSENNSNYQGAVTLLEHNERLGKKLFITGKGRCNVTNACDTGELFENITRNSRFLYSSIYGFDNYRVMDFFEQQGVALKTERGERVFPQSDHSSDIIRALSDAMKKLKVNVVLDCEVKGIVIEDGRVTGVMTKDRTKSPGKDTFICPRVILATGGISYESTGSTGDGLRFARQSGHEVTKLYPSLVPFVCSQEYIKRLQGLSLKNVRLTIFDGKKKLFCEFGEMLFTHFGISGPLVLTASSVIGADRIGEKGLEAFIDLKPALSDEMLDERLLRDFTENKNRNFENSLSQLLPSKLIPEVVSLSQIDRYKKVHEITRAEREKLLCILKHFPMTITGVRGYNEAIVTRGGVSVKDINPSTMESKKVGGLYFCGEMIDVDAKTGGFNLQIAWSTGYLAGMSAAQKTEG